MPSLRWMIAHAQIHVFIFVSGELLICLVYSIWYARAMVVGFGTAQPLSYSMCIVITSPRVLRQGSEIEVNPYSVGMYMFNSSMLWVRTGHKLEMLKSRFVYLAALWLKNILMKCMASSN